MNFTKTTLKLGIGLAIGTSISGTVSAALPANDAVLQFDAGVKSCIQNVGTPPNNCYYGVAVKTGSYFSMDTDSNGFKQSERTPIAMNDGLFIGVTQDASGSHTGEPDGSENAGIDLGWNFFTNTGLHRTTVAPTVINGDNGDMDGVATLDFSGWNVTWNGIPSIALNNNIGAPSEPNGGIEPGFTPGEAILTCFTDAGRTMTGDCSEDDYYTLEYDARVPLGDPSGFSNVHYFLHLEGQIIVPPAAISATTQADGTMSAEGATTPGTFATEAGTNGRLTVDQLAGLSSPIPQATGTRTIDGVSRDGVFSAVGGYFNFAVGTVSGGAADVILTLAPSTIPAGAEFQKWAGTEWVTFTPDGVNNVLGSAMTDMNGDCPTDFVLYDTTGTGLQEGDDCVFIAVMDNDVQYDMDTIVGQVEDPGAVVAFIPDPLAPDLSSSTDGCSMSATPVDPTERADWWLVGGFIAWMGALLFRRRSGAESNA